MHVLLIQPPVRDFYQTAVRTQPIGLAYLAAALKQYGHTAAILDCHNPRHVSRLNLPGQFAFIRPYYTPHDCSPFRLHGGYSHFGLTWHDIACRLRRCRPGVVGISCQFTPYEAEALYTARLVKEIHPTVPVIMGGAHVSACPEHVLRCPDVDFVVLGEGERSLPVLVDAIEAGATAVEIPGCGYTSRGVPHICRPVERIDPLDLLPFPDRGALDLARYTIAGRPYTMLISSRGCPQGCTYCAVAGIMGQVYRCRSPENVIAEIRHCREEYGISVFDIEDDNFTLDRERAQAILEGIIDTYGERTLQFYAMNGLNLISLDGRLLRLLRQAGFQRLDMAQGTLSRTESVAVHRFCDPEKTNRVLRRAAALGIPSTTYILLGLPDQSLQSMCRAVASLAGQQTLLGPSVFYPVPGTPLHDRLYGNRATAPPAHELLRSSLLPVETGQCSRLDLVTLLRAVRWINFIKQLLPALCVERLSVTELRDLADREDWTGGVVPDRDGCTFTRPKPLGKSAAGKLITAMLLDQGQFFGIKRLRTRASAGRCGYRIFPWETSAEVFALLPGDPTLEIAAAQTRSTAAETRSFPYVTGHAHH